MARKKLQPDNPWAVAGRQHGVLTRMQLLALGFSPEAIDHRIECGRLHPVSRGVYAVGRPELTRRGVWMAAVLSCGAEAVLSHFSAAALLGIWRERPHAIEVSVPPQTFRNRPGIVAHRRSLTAHETTVRHGIPVTAPATTIVDIAPGLTRHELEAAINEADKLDLIDPEALREAAGEVGRRRGASNVRRVLDRRTFTLTDSQTERRFLPIARRAGLSLPQTQVYVKRLQGRLLLAGSRPDRGDGRSALPPHAGRAGPRSRTRPDPHRRRPHLPALHPRAGALRAGARRGGAQLGGGASSSSGMTSTVTTTFGSSQ